MKIVFFSFYFPPDLGAGSFRSSSLCDSLKNKLNNNDEIHVITSHPNRYKSHLIKADDFEIDGNIKIHRIKVPSHTGSMFSQVITFFVFSYFSIKLSKQIKPDFLIGTSSRLMTAYLTYFCSRIQKLKYFIDLRDIFSETISDIFSLKNRYFGYFLRNCFIFLEKRVLNSASGVNAVSQGFPDYFNSLGIDTSRWFFYCNGIDKEFLNLRPVQNNINKRVKTILYAGNIGDGQGLDLIIPSMLNDLDSQYRFLVVGDGGSLLKLKNSIPLSKVPNIEFLSPVERHKLIQYYLEADILFLHLNNIPAFKRVLPSKIFEYAAIGKPIVAGVSGFSAEFMKKNIPYAYIFKPCDTKGAIKCILESSNCKVSENAVNEFKEKNARELIMNGMAENIMNIIKTNE